ncbi:MAG: RDD family protein [Actinomycetota bacterium]|nr:RDD family protein [Actinomycetota bacterium]
MTNDKAPGSDGLFSRVFSRATGAVVDIVDPDTIIEQVDVNALMDRVDVDTLLDRVDVNALLERVDPDVILDNVDVNALMDRVDVDALLDRVDVNTLMNRVDIDALLDRVDVKELTDRAGIPDIVRESTGALAGSAMDVVRRQIVALDQIVGKFTYRLIRRHPSERPVAPPDLKAGAGVDEIGRGQMTGHYAGAVSRLVAYAIDWLIISGVFVLGLMGTTFVFDVIFNTEIGTEWQHGVIGLALGALWTLGYHTIGLALAGRTIGMGIIGLMVVSREGATITGRQALVRALVFPLSFLIFGLGFLGIITSPERRAMHDAAAGTVVVYDWGDRPAEMPAPLTSWVNRHTEDD